MNFLYVNYDLLFLTQFSFCFRLTDTFISFIDLMAENSLTYTLDEALTSVGFGKFQGFALVFAGVGWLADSMEMMLLSFIGPAVQSEWKLSPSEESLLSTAVFAGMLVGSFLWGLVSDSYGRR